MAGVKGRSGGPRANSGGARPGSGRKPKPKPPIVDLAPELPEVRQDKLDMLEMLQAVALGKIEASPLQVRAAIAAVQYTHTKRGDGGKKDEIAEKAKQAAAGGGKFSPSAPPRLVANNSR